MLAAGHLIALNSFTEKSEEVGCLNQGVLFLLPYLTSLGATWAFRALNPFLHLSHARRVEKIA